MARSSSICLILTLLLVAAATQVAATALLAATVLIANAIAIKEIQELGKFCVLQYNKNLRYQLSQSRRQGPPPLLVFQGVTVAEKQVEAGIKYTLTINAKEGSVEKTFKADLFVNSNSQVKKLLSFSPFTPLVMGSTTGPPASALGGLTMIGDVKTNKEVQELGKVAIEQFNSKYHSVNGVSKTLSFEQVVEAGKQIVNGIKYQLTIIAKDDTGRSDTFRAELVVKNQSAQLMSFAPATGTPAGAGSSNPTPLGGKAENVQPCINTNANTMQ